MVSINIADKFSSIGQLSAPKLLQSTAMEIYIHHRPLVFSVKAQWTNSCFPPIKSLESFVLLTDGCSKNRSLYQHWYHKLLWKMDFSNFKDFWLQIFVLKILNKSNETKFLINMNNNRGKILFAFCLWNTTMIVGSPKWAHYWLTLFGIWINYKHHMKFTWPSLIWISVQPLMLLSYNIYKGYSHIFFVI